MALLRLDGEGRLVPDTPGRRPHHHVRNLARWQRLRERVIAEEPRCRLCGSEEDPEADHIAPLHAGGRPFDGANVQRLCMTCNRRKGGR